MVHAIPARSSWIPAKRLQSISTAAVLGSGTCVTEYPSRTLTPKAAPWRTQTRPLAPSDRLRLYDSFSPSAAVQKRHGIWCCAKAGVTTKTSVETRVRIRAKAFSTLVLSTGHARPGKTNHFVAWDEPS